MPRRLEPEPAERESAMAHVVERNIRVLLQRRREADRRRTLQDRAVDAVTAFMGSIRFVYIHVVIFGVWIGANLGWVPLVPRFDPDLVHLAMAASVEAIFLATFVLIAQNRMAALTDRRSDLDLQISLLAEHEVTRILTLTSAIAERLGIEMPNDTELAELSKDVRPEKVLDRIEETESEVAERADPTRS